jgi:hypothetical protein
MGTFIYPRRRLITASVLGLTVAAGSAWMFFSKSDESEGGVAAAEHGRPLFEKGRQHTIERARLLMRLYFGADRTVESYAFGPAGTVELITRDRATGGLHRLYMLPDQQHLIEGELYSPHISPKELSERHSTVTRSLAERNQTVSAAREAHRQKLVEAIAGSRQNAGALAREATAERVQAEVLAKREHVRQIAATETVATPVAAPAPRLATPAPVLETAVAPKINTLIDKDQLYADIEANKGWIARGNAPKVLYVFYDFNCPACREVERYLDEYVASGKAQIRYVPVGMLGEDSLARATFSLVPTDNTHRLKMLKLMQERRPLAELIPQGPSKEDQDRGYRLAMNNLKLLVSTRRTATPGFIYKTATGPMFSFINSKRDLDALVDQIVPTAGR